MFFEDFSACSSQVFAVVLRSSFSPGCRSDFERAILGWCGGEKGKLGLGVVLIESEEEWD